VSDVPKMTSGTMNPFPPVPPDCGCGCGFELKIISASAVWWGREALNVSPANPLIFTRYRTITLEFQNNSTTPFPVGVPVAPFGNCVSSQVTITLDRLTGVWTGNGSAVSTNGPVSENWFFNPFSMPSGRRADGPPVSASSTVFDHPWSSIYGFVARMTLSDAVGLDEHLQVVDDLLAGTHGDFRNFNPAGGSGVRGISWQLTPAQLETFPASQLSGYGGWLPTAITDPDGWVLTFPSHSDVNSWLAAPGPSVEVLGFAFVPDALLFNFPASRNVFDPVGVTQRDKLWIRELDVNQKNWCVQRQEHWINVASGPAPSPAMACRAEIIPVPAGKEFPPPATPDLYANPDMIRFVEETFIRNAAPGVGGCPCESLGVAP